MGTPAVRAAALAALSISLALLSPAPRVFGQDQPPAHLAVIDGSQTLERDGQQLAAAIGMPIVAGDRLSTARGRAEVRFEDGSALDLDEYTSIDVASLTLIRLNRGRV